MFIIIYKLNLTVPLQVLKLLITAITIKLMNYNYNY